jgi:hypothetical protein
MQQRQTSIRDLQAGIVLQYQPRLKNVDVAKRGEAVQLLSLIFACDNDPDFSPDFVERRAPPGVFG